MPANPLSLTKSGLAGCMFRRSPYPLFLVPGVRSRPGFPEDSGVLADPFLNVWTVGGIFSGVPVRHCP